MLRSLIGTTLAGAALLTAASTQAPTVALASGHREPSSCTVALGNVIDGQQRLLVSAWSLPADASLLEAQTGVQSVWVTTDATGAVSDQSLYYQGPGAYTIDFYTLYWKNNREVQATVTSCSAQL